MRAESGEKNSMALGWETIPVDDGGISRKMEKSWFGISFLSEKFNMVRKKLLSIVEDFTCGLGVTLPISTQLKPRFNKPIGKIHQISFQLVM